MNQLAQIRLRQEAETLAVGISKFDSLTNLVEEVKGSKAYGGSGTFTAAFGNSILTITEHFQVEGSKVMLVATTVSSS